MTTREVTPPRDQPVLTAIAIGSMALVLPVLLLAGDFRLVTVPGVLLATALVATGRDTLHALGALVIVSVLWLASHADHLTPWSLVVAALMLTAHSAVALRSCLPPSAAISREIGIHWVRRCAVVLAVTGLVYLLGISVHQLHRGDSQTLVVLALVLVGGLVLLLRRETIRTHDS